MRLEAEQARLLLRRCTARVHIAGQHVGSAFFVGPGRLLSCAHVVATDARVVYGNVTIQWWAGTRFQSFPVAVSLAPSPEVDLAVLQITGAAPDHPCVALYSGLLSSRDALTSYGYPAHHPDGDGATLETESQSGHANSSLLTLKDGNVDRGSSGSPLLHDRFRGVCGVLAWSRDPTSALGGRAIPIGLAVAQWPQLRGWQRQAHEGGSAWSELLPVSLWRAAQRQQHERELRQEINQHASTVPSPLTPRWNAFCANEGWHTRMEGAVTALKKEMTQVMGPAEGTGPIPAIHFEANYDGILADLRPSVTQDIPDWIRTQLRELGQRQDEIERDKEDYQSRNAPEVADLNAELERISALRRKLQRLRQSVETLAREVTEPRFERCFLILGDLGSGKTHFLITRLSIRESGTETLVALVRPQSVGTTPLDAFLLQLARERTRVEWDSLAELDGYLGALEVPPRLVIAVDDLQASGGIAHFPRALAELIAQHTQLHSIYYAIALDHQAYLQIAAAGSLWNTYGYLADPQGDRAAGLTLGSWQLLDELSWVERTGLAIIESQLRTEGGEDSQLLSRLHRAEPPTLRQLSKPFIAWTLLESRTGTEAAPLVDLYFINFIETFWNRLLPRLREDAPGQQRLKTCVALIVSHLMATGDFSPVAAALESYLIEGSRNKSDLGSGDHAHVALAELETGGVLKQFDAPDPEIESVRQVEFTFAVFWNWRLGLRLQADLARAQSQGKKTVEFLDGWFGKHNTTRPPADGMVQFLLLASDVEQLPRDDGAQLRHLWRWAAFSANAPPGSAWLAASKCRPVMRDRLARWLLTPAPAVRADERDLFAFIYFLASLSGRLPGGVRGAQGQRADQESTESGGSGAGRHGGSCVLFLG